MLNKHFLKTLIIFSGMILLGLVGIFVVSYLDKVGAGDSTTTDTVSR